MTKRVTTWIACLVLLQGACTLGMMAQMSGPKEAKEPAHVSWPEVQPLADQAAADFARKDQGEVLATYLTQRNWTSGTNEENGHYERGTGVWLFWKRKGGAMVKGAKGESGVCFQHDCSLVQQQSDGQWQAPFLDCADHSQVKVTCESVSRFSSSSVPSRRAAAHPAPSEPAAAPAVAAPPAGQRAARPAQSDTDAILADKANFRVKLAALRIAEPGATGKKVLLEVAADGGLMLMGRPGGRISEKGLYTDASGRSLGAVDREGNVWTIVRGKAETIGRIKGASIEFGQQGKVLAIGRDGSIEMKGRKLETSKERLTPRGVSREMALLAAFVAVISGGVHFN